jgi:hypothetical protein
MFALDWIDLGKMPWINIIANGLGLDRPADPAE